MENDKTKPTDTHVGQKIRLQYQHYGKFCISPHLDKEEMVFHKVLYKYLNFTLLLQYLYISVNSC